MRHLVICGAGGHAREVILAARQAQDVDVIGLLDDRPHMWGRIVSGVEILGGVATASVSAGVEVFPGGVGDPASKRRFAHAVEDRRWRMADPLVHPLADIGEARLGAGVFVAAFACLTVDVTVGDHVTINRGAHLSHDVVVGEAATVSPGVHVSGNVTVGEGAYLCVASSVREQVTIGPEAIVGGGSFVNRDVPAGARVGGVPARPLTR